MIGPDDVVCLLWIIAGIHRNWYFGTLAEVYISGFKYNIHLSWELRFGVWLEIFSQ